MAKNEYTRKALPSVPEFKEIKDDAERRLIYMRAFKALCEGRVFSQEKRRRLLENYAVSAGWDNESVLRMQSAVQTLIHHN